MANKPNTSHRTEPASKTASASSGCSVNRGVYHYRTESPHSRREKALADAWEKENEPKPNIDYGHGILQDLFCKNHPQWGIAFGGVATHVLTDRERMIAATAIQWLGSNCGWCFLENALRDCGYKIVRIEDSQNAESSCREPENKQ